MEMFEAQKKLGHVTFLGYKQTGKQRDKQIHLKFFWNIFFLIFGILFLG